MESGFAARRSVPDLKPRPNGMMINPLDKLLSRAADAMNAEHSAPHQNVYVGRVSRLAVVRRTVWKQQPATAFTPLHSIAGITNFIG